MPIDLAHFMQRLVEPFNAESRFYWPLAAAVLVAIVAHTVWYYWRPRGEGRSPDEQAARPWVYWIDVIFLIWALVLLLAKVPFLWYVASLALNVALLVYVYAYWLPPRDRAWERELRRQKYIPKPERRRRR